MRPFVFISLLLLSFALIACGTSTQDRALSGAGVGAGLGAGTSLIADGDPLTGAAVGAAAGAATGALTDEEDINLEDTFDGLND